MCDVWAILLFKRRKERKRGEKWSNVGIASGGIG